PLFCPMESSEIRDSRCHQTSFRAMSAPQTKVDQQLAIRNKRAPHGLGREHRLPVEDIDQRALHELSLRDGCGPSEYRFVRKEDSSLWHCIHVTGKTPMGEMIHE